MNQVALPDTPVPTIPASPADGTRLLGRQRIIARWLWIAAALLFCLPYCWALYVYYIQLGGYKEGVYASLIATPGAVSGYDAIASLYLGFASPLAGLNITLFSALWIAVSLLIFWHRSDDWMALFVALFLVMLATNFVPALPAIAHLVGYTSPVGLLLILLHVLSWSSAGCFFALFPDGHFVPGWTRVLTLVYLAWQVPFCLPSDSAFSILHWPPGLIAVLMGGFVFGWGYAQLYRYRHVSSAIQRQQTKWIVFGMLVGTVIDVASMVLLLTFPGLGQTGTAYAIYTILSDVVLPLAFLLIPCTVGVAMLRYHLWDVDLLINRTLVYGLLTSSIAGFYLLVVVGLGALFEAFGNVLISLLATGLVAVLFQPLHNRLQRAVNRLMYGERDDPYRVLARLGSRLEATLATEALLPTIVETVAQALKLPYVAISYKQSGIETLATSTGTLKLENGLLRVPLVVQTEQVGDLVLAARAAGESLTSADLNLLHDLAPQIAVALQAMRLTGELRQMTRDLQESRTRLITAREEERRRLRRDLHDGLGPALASLTFKIDAARNLLTSDSERADRLLVGVRQQVQEAIADIRRLVYDLRPPALDELGLISALREQVASYGHQELQITVEAPEILPPLPAAVEVAAYRIAQEALTNVIRYANAGHCLLRLSIHKHALVLQVSDDGKGIAPGHHIGVGLLAMQERTVELRGNCTIGPGPGGGTTVIVSLPLDRAADTESPSSSDEAH